MNRVQPKSKAELLEIVPALAAMEQASGYIPTSFHVLAHRPEIVKTLLPFAGAVLGPGEVDRGLKQLIAQMVSTVTGCRYCQAHTAHGGHALGTPESKLQALWEFETDPQFSAAERSALRLARDSAMSPNAVTDEHFKELRQHFNEPQIVELVATASLFGYFNRFNDTLANDLEAAPAEWAEATLGGVGWEIGKHVAAR